jgi:H+-translocating NAD(P) transhydrogenase subunit beta
MSPIALLFASVSGSASSAETLINLSYIVAAILFIFGLKMLGRAETARRGNLISAVGMLLAVVVTLLSHHILSYQLLVVGLVLGGAIGAVAARMVKMTAMPEMVALFNGFGGLASLLVGWAEYEKINAVGWAKYLESFAGSPSFTSSVIFLAALIGGITFTGSVYAYLKLSGKASGRPKLFRGQQMLNIALLAAAAVCGIAFAMLGDGSAAYTLLLVSIGLALALGFLIVMPIGGGDMPVVIALLNSLSGIAAAAAGFVIANNVLIVAGCLVGASGLILTIIMCKAMNRSLPNVLFSGFGATVAAEGSDSAITGELKPISASDVYYALEAARSVVVVPGYGMAVAQAQHLVRELGDLLEANGTEVRFAIHPVAGRMPGHMNVLLAEANVPYEQLVEMDAINPSMPTVDVCMVIGANDVVNPAATRDKSSPIYGMPIINAHEARTVICMKRGKGAGFSGLENALFLMPNSRMLYGDAKATLQQLVAEFKSAAAT